MTKMTLLPQQHKENISTLVKRMTLVQKGSSIYNQQILKVT